METPFNLVSNFVRLSNNYMDQRKSLAKRMKGFPAKPDFSDAEVTFMTRLNELGEGATTREEQELLTQRVELAHFCTRWACFGFPEFKLTQDLTSALMLTDASSVQTGEVRWPFTSFMISLPPDAQSPIVYTDMEGQGMVEGKTVMVHSMLVPSKEYNFSFDTIYDQAIHQTIKEPHKAWQVYEALARKVPKIIRTVIRVLDSGDLYSIFHANKWPSDEEPISSWIKCDGIDRTENLVAKDHFAMRATARLITNFSLYLAEQQQERKWSNKAAFNRQANASKGFVSTPTEWILGKEIHLPGHYHDMARAYSEQGFKKDGKRTFRVHAQQVVMGHWRRQSPKEKKLIETAKFHPGDGRAQRWVGPYDRNTEGTKLGFRKSYTVDLPQK